MKIIVLGSGGMLGHLTTLYLQEKGYQVENLSHKFKIGEDTKLIDVAHIRRIEAYLDESRPDIIINCIALLVRQSEENKAKAIYVNSFFPQWLGEKYKQTHTKIIHVSTDGVFSGKRGQYTEWDESDVGTFYGKSKNFGEILNHKDLNIRSGFWGPDTRIDGTGLMNWFMQQTTQVTGYCNVVFNGVTSLEFAKFVEYAIKQNISGIYHLTAKEPISKYDLLVLMNDRVRKEKVVIQKVYDKCSNHELISTRQDYRYQPKSYEEMLVEIKDWVSKHLYLYTHYVI